MAAITVFNVTVLASLMASLSLQVQAELSESYALDRG
jgi:hypothetical protein